jgi:hypothetical protein
VEVSVIVLILILSSDEEIRFDRYGSAMLLR